MAEKIVMPKLAMAMKRGKVIEWKAGEGEWVEKGKVVMVIETEKVTYECEAPASGHLHVIVELDKAIPVNETVALLAETEAELAKLQAEQPAPATLPKPKKAAAEAPAATGGGRGKKVKITPRAKRIAKEHGLDVTRITGSGPGGRITEKDVQAAIEAGTAVEAAAETAGPTIDGKRVKSTIPLKGMRKAIAEHMVESLAVSAQLTTSGEIDMTQLIRLRKTLLKKEAEIGVRVTYTDLIVLAMAKAARQVPMINSSIIDDEIVIWEDINIGVATSVEVGEYETGLIVPVLKNADKKSLAEISRSIKDLTTRAREAKLTPDDVSGGTLTISNIGMMARGWTVSTPILNQPQAVMFQPGKIADRPVVKDGQLTVAPIMTYSITFDHRMLDGVPISKFMNLFIDMIEEPGLLAL